ncbi:MAG: glycosyltransferase family 1 protein [Chloroflexi bacterium]|nr:glycosyltransferase family 1 protein [Chloroflexota bacterium]
MLRILAATAAGAGHFAPMVPFAAALRDAGHVVRVAAPASVALAVQRAGFEHVPLADAPPEEIGPIAERLPQLAREDANAVVVREVFCGIGARAALPGMQAVVEEWRPDVILRETAEFASYVVAARAGIPHVDVAMSLASVEAFMHAQVDEALSALGSPSGVAGLAAAPRLTLVPASLEDPSERASRPSYRFGDAQRSASPARLPPTWYPEPEAPLVYVTFGSVAARLGFFPDFYRAIATALADVPVRILLTLGEAGNPQLLGPLPSNVHVETWWPQEQVMPHATAMVTHGGFTTSLLGLSSGLPMVVVPLFAVDQYTNARRIQAVGAGISIDDSLTAPARVRSALERVFNDATYRAAARRVADEMAHLPHPRECVHVFEALVNDTA